MPSAISARRSGSAKRSLDDGHTFSEAALNNQYYLASFCLSNTLCTAFNRPLTLHCRSAIADALLLRGSADFDDLTAYRRFIDEIVSRRNARNAERIDSERTALQDLPDRRTSDYEEVIVRVTSSGRLHPARCFTRCRRV